MDSSESSLELQNDRAMTPEQESFPQETIFARGRSRGAEEPTDTTTSQGRELSASPTKRRRLPQQNSKLQTVRLFQGLGVSGCLLVGHNPQWILYSEVPEAIRSSKWPTSHFYHFPSQFMTDALR
jgi:hypothetical protein